MKPIHYKRAQFSTYLPQDRLYTPSHFWIAEEEGGVCRVGFTKFATRMLGEIVECQFDVSPGHAVTPGQVIGSLEAFKAITDLYCVAEGSLVEINPAMNVDASVVSSFPYAQGWLYKVKGTPDDHSFDVHEYIRILNDTIDRMQEKEGQAELEPVEEN